MFKTLRSKLIATYALIVVLCLVLAGAAAVVLFNNYQERVARRNMQILVTALSAQIRTAIVQRPRPGELERRLRQMARSVNARLLLLDQAGQVLNDTEGEAGPGFRLKILEPPGPSQGVFRLVSGRVPIGRAVDPSGDAFYYVTVALPRPPTAPPDVPRYLALAMPVHEVRGAWRALAPSLLLVGLAVFVIATAIGGLLARSVSRPVAEMTRAAEAMAHGDYDQQIVVEGDDEVARLGYAFNTMAREVSRAHRMQRDFVTNVSHDLKTPLTSIQGFAQALLDGTAEAPEDRHRAAQIIFEEAERMRRLVHTLLELAKLESGQSPLADEPVDLAPLLQDAVRHAMPRAEAKRIELRARVPETLPTIRGDAARLVQVFDNLLDNALTYTPPGGTVEISAALTSEGMLEVVVADTGEGIPPEDLPRIFERFYRADKARAGDSSTGLGLAIVKEIVTAHGGHVTASSQPGQGTRFTVTLPLADRTSQNKPSKLG